MQQPLFGGDGSVNPKATGRTKPKEKPPPTTKPDRPGGIPPNKSVEACDKARLSKQGMLIYRAMLVKPRLNLELSNLNGPEDKPILVQNLTARLSEIRKWLLPQCKRVWSLRITRGSDEPGLFLYGIGDWKPGAKSHRLVVSVRIAGDKLLWNCPRCGESVARCSEKFTGDQIQKRPLCRPCAFWVDLY